MSQACEKCCGKLIPGPHQLAGVWITCAAGKPHSAPPLSFVGWCLRLWVRSIPPPLDLQRTLYDMCAVISRLSSTCWFQPLQRFTRCT